MKIAILGTFDLQNYGDLLFPLLAQHELGRRLKEVELLPFSYRSKSPPEWPYEVHPVEDLPQRLAEIDAVIVGGGHLVRFDQDLADDYGPGSPAIHHPTGLWLIPPFLAAAARRPVVWNAVGASPDLQDWAIPLLRAALEASVYVSARDRASRSTLRTVADEVDVPEVPDTAFGISELLQNPQIEDSFHQWREQQGLRGPYLVVQASPKLEPVLDAIRYELDDLRAAGTRVVELPIGPVLGDRTGWIAPDRRDVLRVDPWPHPLLVAQIIAHSEASVGVSLHLGITSLCHGVPVHRPRCWPGSKYEILGEFQDVYQFDENGRPPRPRLRAKVGRGNVSPRVREQQERLKRHWDRVAEAVDAAVGTRWNAVARFFFGLPFDLDRGHGAQLVAQRLEAQIGEERDLRRNVESTQLTLTAELEELRRSREQIESQLAQERARRRDLENHWGRLEERLGELSSRVAEIASLKKESDDLRETLDGIYRSRAWRTSVLLRKIYLVLAAPWRRVRNILERARSPNP